MRLGRLGLGLLSAAVIAGPALVGTAWAQKSVSIPMATYRTGPFSVSGVPYANGFSDYMTLLNERDGGVEGVKIDHQECEFGYKTDRGVECYESLKAKGAIAYSPMSTGVTYKVIPKARFDKIVVFSMGYGMSAAADGRWFPWVFNFPTTYWSQASAFIRYIAEQEGGFAKLKGKKIGLIYLESGYGREPIPLLKTLGKKYGYTLKTYSVPFKDGQLQQSQWRQIVKWKPDWMLMWGWGVMNRTAILRASEFGFPLNRFIGVWWSGTDADTAPVGMRAKGYRAGTFHAVGKNFKAFRDIMKYVYGRGAGTDKKTVGEVLYNRGVLNAMYLTEALRDTIKRVGTKTIGTDAFRDAFRSSMEHLNITEARLKKLGLAGFVRPIKITCADHEGNGPIMIQRWDGKKWIIIQRDVKSLRKIVRPMLEAAAAEEGKKFGFKERKNCN